MSDKELCELMDAAIEGDITEANFLRLEAELIVHPAARKAYFDRVALHQALTQEAQAMCTPSPVAQRPPSRFASWLSWRPLAAAAVVAILLSLGWKFLQPREAGVLRIVAVEGVVRWTGGRGAVVDGLHLGAALPGGLIETISEDSTVSVMFADGSVVTLFGLSSVAFSADGQKRVHLREGTLSASVKPQAAGRPMLIRTASAEAEIVGTEFSMSAGLADTSLRVDTGRVRLRRLMDGRVVDVGNDERATATLDASTDMKVLRIAPVPVQWRRTLERPVPEAWRGRWLPAETQSPARVSAVPYVARGGKDGSPVVFHGISFRSESGDQKSFVRLTSESVVGFRYRLPKPAPLTAFISCVTDKGGFAGNFESAPIQAVADGLWHEIEIPVDHFHPLMRGHPLPAGGRQVFLLLIHSGRRDAGLEITEASAR